jgi:hypothetical protein
MGLREIRQLRIRKRPISKTLIASVVIPYTILSFVYMFVYFFHSPTNTTIVDKFFRPLWNLTDEAVFSFLLRTVNVLFISVIFPGMIIAFLLLLAFSIAFNISVAVIQFLTWIVRLGPAGAVAVFGGLGLSLAWLAYHKYRDYREHALRAMELIISAFLWLTDPQHRKKLSQEKKRIMDDKAKEDELREQASKLAEVVGMNQSQLPVTLEGYSGFFQEARKRVQMRSHQRTQQEVLILLDQAIAFHTGLLTLRRAQGALDRVRKENVVEDLKLDEQELAVQVRIKKLRRELDEEGEDPKPKSPIKDDEDIVGN